MKAWCILDHELLELDWAAVLLESVGLCLANRHVVLAVVLGKVRRVPPT